MTRPRQWIFSALLAPVLLSGCAAVVVAPAPLAAPAPKEPVQASCPVPSRSARDVPAVVAAVNAERAKAGLVPLVLSQDLSRIAHAFACEAAARGDIGHRGADGAGLGERLARGGIAARLAAENNAAGQTSPAEVVAAWMASPGHRANILRPELRRIGIGQADGPWPVWVADFTS